MARIYTYDDIIRSLRTAWEERDALEQRIVVSGSVGVAFVIFLGMFAFWQDTALYYASGKPLVREAKSVWYQLSWSFAPELSGAAAAALSFDRIASTTDRVHAESVPVLAYHGITGGNDASTINLTEEQFREHMVALKAEGYTTITPAELFAFVRGEMQLPDRSILITFDDGRRDSFERATPILDALDFEATMFLISKFSSRESPDSSYYLEGPALSALVRSDVWNIGSHSHDGHEIYSEERGGSFESHFFGGPLFQDDLGRVETEEEFRRRISEDYLRSQQLLEELTGEPIRFFSFPFGDIGENIDEGGAIERVVIEEAAHHYNMLFYQTRQGEHFSHAYPDRFSSEETPTIMRIDVHNNWSDRDLINILERGYAKSVPYEDTFSEDRGWISSWGEQTFSTSTLTLEPAENDTGASTVLDGTGHWKDYALTTHVTRLPETSTFLFVRFQDDFNNVGCNFGDGFVHAEEIVNGEHRVIRGVRSPSLTPSGPVELNATVSGREITCSINGTPVVQTPFINPDLQSGGIGLKTWHPLLNRSELTIHELTVNEI